MTIEPIRTLHGIEAKWALTVQPGEMVPAHDGHCVTGKEISYSIDSDDIWIVIKCSCGQTFSGALR